MSNFVVRTLVGILFVAIMVAGMLFYPLGFAALLLFVLYFSLREFLTITLGQRWLAQQKIALFASALIYLLVVGHCFYAVPLRWLALGIVPLLALPISVVMAPSHENVEHTALAWLGVLYITLPFALAPIMVSQGGEFRGYVLLCVFIIIWCSDIGAYCIGTLLGQKPNSAKLAPAISPKKSWWGFWGGVVLGTGAAVGLHFVGWMEYSLVHCIALGALISVTGVCGDLFESVWKRRYGVKDSGNIIPGHGGMLDRFDSSLLAIPAAFAWLAAFGLL